MNRSIKHGKAGLIISVPILSIASINTRLPPLFSFFVPPQTHRKTVLTHLDRSGGESDTKACELEGNS